jgi:hypothetical protein
MIENVKLEIPILDPKIGCWGDYSPMVGAMMITSAKKHILD